MAQLHEKDLRTVIEDARARHAAVLGVIYAIDAQAMSLLRLYVTLGIAAASGAAAGLGSSPVFNRPMTLALIAGMLVFIAGAGFCLRAMRRETINLPGRGAAFWKWAISPEVQPEAVLSAYLDNLEQKATTNDAVNRRAATALTRAKQCGMFAPLGAVVIGIAAAQWSF